MADTKSSRHSPKKQPKKHPAELKEAEKQIRDEIKARARYLKKLGLYRPEKITGSKYQRARVRRLEEQYAPLLDTTKFEVVIYEKSKAAQKTIKRQAKQSGFKATGRAIFVPSKQGESGHRLVKVRGTDRYAVVAEGRSKRSGKPVRTVITPLGEAALVQREMRKIMREAQAQGKFLGPSTYMRIISYDQYLWKRAYTDVDLFLEDLNAYHQNEWQNPYHQNHPKTEGEFNEFLENLQIIITPSDMTWKQVKAELGLEPEKKPQQPPKGFRKVNHSGRN